MAVDYIEMTVFSYNSILDFILSVAKCVKGNRAFRQNRNPGIFKELKITRIEIYRKIISFLHNFSFSAIDI